MPNYFSAAWDKIRHILSIFLFYYWAHKINYTAFKSLSVSGFDLALNKGHCVFNSCLRDKEKHKTAWEFVLYSFTDSEIPQCVDVKWDFLFKSRESVVCLFFISNVKTHYKTWFELLFRNFSAYLTLYWHTAWRLGVVDGTKTHKQSLRCSLCSWTLTLVYQRRMKAEPDQC